MRDDGSGGWLVSRLPLCHLVPCRRPVIRSVLGRVKSDSRPPNRLIACGRARRSPFSVKLRVVVAIAVLPLCAFAQSDPAPRPPFPLGEALNYRVHVARGGNVGHGQMRVEGPITDGAELTWRLVFELQAGRGPIRASDQTVSWLDPSRFAMTRFEKTERHLLSRSSEQVVVSRSRGEWYDAAVHDSPETATWHPLGHTAPLDELSFLYFLRTIPLGRDTTFQVSRHFDAARNPTTIRVMGEELVETPVGIFRTRVVEMDVRDPKRYRGIGTIRLNIDTADCHVPVRIVSQMPILGATTLLLVGWVSPPRYPGVMRCEQ